MPDGNYNNFSTMLIKLGSFFRFKKHQQDNNSAVNKLNFYSISENLEEWSNYQNLKAEDIMIPRVDISAIDCNYSLEAIAQHFLKTQHTRMPVFQNDLDKIIGFINIKDIMPYILNAKDKAEFDITKILRDMLIISPSMKIMNLLDKMKQNRTHIALVVDEFGGTDGLITIEDLIEEIVGKIEDEHDNNQIDFKEIAPQKFEASGRMEIKELEERLQTSFSSASLIDKYDTLGGLILSLYGSVPKKGTKIVHPLTNISFDIIESDPRRIKKVLISLNTINEFAIKP
jgi:magnesium and cobalt transporter